MDNFKELEAKAVAAWTQYQPERDVKREHDYKLYKDAIANAVATAIAKEGPECQAYVHVQFDVVSLERLKAELQNQGYTFLYDISGHGISVCVAKEKPKPDPKGFENVVLPG